MKRNQAELEMKHFMESMNSILYQHEYRLTEVEDKVDLKEYKLNDTLKGRCKLDGIGTIWFKNHFQNYRNKAKIRR